MAVIRKLAVREKDRLERSGRIGGYAEVGTDVVPM